MMNTTTKIIYLLLLTILISAKMYAEEPFVTLPSDQTRQEINQLSAPPVESPPTRDWWSGSRNGAGPPSSGSGGGGAVGTALLNGTVPIAVAVLIYLTFLVIKTRRRKP